MENKCLLKQKDWLLVLRSNLIIGVIWTFLLYIIAFNGEAYPRMLVLLTVGLLIALVLCQLGNALLLLPWQMSNTTLLIILFIVFALIFVKQRQVLQSVFFLVFPIINFVSIGLRKM